MDAEQFSNNNQVINDDAGGVDERHTSGSESPPPPPSPLKKQKADDEPRDETGEEDGEDDDEERYETGEEDDEDDGDEMHTSETNSDQFHKFFCFVDEEGTVRKVAFHPKGYEPGDIDVWVKYLREIKESEGFDIYHYPGMCDAAPFHPLDVVGNQLLIDRSVDAIRVYNREKCKNYGLEEVEKANSELWGTGANLYITFRAKDSNTNACDTFQAKVWIGSKSLPEPVVVEFCRLK